MQGKGSGRIAVSELARYAADPNSIFQRPSSKQKKAMKQGMKGHSNAISHSTVKGLIKIVVTLFLVYAIKYIIVGS